MREGHVCVCVCANWEYFFKKGSWKWKDELAGEHHPQNTAATIQPLPGTLCT